MSTPITARPLPPPLENPCPPCSICGETTEYDGAFYCAGCGCSWDSELSHLDGHSSWNDPELPQCPAAVAPWKGSVRYPALAEVIEHCLLTEGHDPGRHRSGDHDWTDEDADGYRLTDADRLALLPSALSVALAKDIVATARVVARDLLRGIQAT